MNITLCLQNAVPRLPQFRFMFPINWTIRKGEQWAVVGPNGAGKTLLADLIRGKHVLKDGLITFSEKRNISDFVRSIAFKDIHSLTDSHTSYYQQRWHSTENDEIMTVRECLNLSQKQGCVDSFFVRFDMEKMLDKKIVFLSSGELRKFLILRILLTEPRVLILDNPYIGLDAKSRVILTDLLKELFLINELQIILLLSDPKDIPDMITHILPVRERCCYEPVSRVNFQKNIALEKRLFSTRIDETVLPEIFSIISEHKITLRMENVTIRYGSRTILNGIDWEIKSGEKWALLGENGSGKSTLLSLVYADNPQSYANTIFLFDRKRGTGESIWEIKKKIGYVSPEMHLYYMEDVTAIRIVGSGFFDSVGLYRKCNIDQERMALEWMNVLGIEALKDRSFLSLSSGEQRLVLLARCFVKDPDLLILDEPLHGLDVSNKCLVKRVIETFCSRSGKTLIYVTHCPQEMPSCIDRIFKLTKQDQL